MARFLNIFRLRDFTTAADTAAEISAINDTEPRLKIDAGGKHTWGDGSTAGDTTLYRSGANELKTDDAFVAAGGLTVSGYQIDTTGASVNDVLTFNGSLWSGASIPAINALDDIADVDVASAITDDVLTYNGSIWVAASFSAGTQGPQGPQGPQGADSTVAGPQGDTGPQGPQGDTGPQGPQGDIGPQGDTGPQGPQGDVGPQGPQGSQGATGSQGPQGGVGPQGPQGDIGPQGPQGADSTVAGPQGPQGDTGPQGPQGPQGGVGPQGGTGPQGSQGPQGPQGASGVAGALDDLTDVNAPAPADGDVLTWDDTAGEWISAASTGGGVAGTTYTATIGNNSDNTFTVTHGLGTRNVYVTARQATAPYDNIEVLWSATTTNTITVDFSTVPDTNSITVTVYAAVTGTPVTTTLSALTDVILSSPTSGQVLEYNGSTWVNSATSVSQMADTKMMAIITMDIGA